MVIDCDNEQRFKYIYSIIRGKGEPHRLPDGIVVYPSMIKAYPSHASLNARLRSLTHSIILILAKIYVKY